MKNKVKKIAYVISGFVLLAPVLVFAQAYMDNAQSSDLPGGTIFEIIQQLMFWLLGIVGFLAIIGFLISGVLYLTSAGDEGKMETAKKAMTYSIIGIVVALAGFVIIQAINTLLGGQDEIF